MDIREFVEKEICNNTNQENEQLFYDTFEDFVEQNKDRPFRYWVYRRMFTPKEVVKQFSDESFFEDAVCQIAYIRKCIKLPSNDYLLGFEDQELAELKHKQEYLEFYKLSEIRLAMHEIDTNKDD